MTEKDVAAALPAIFLHFEPGRRPSRRQVIDCLAGSNRLFVSHDPGQVAQRSTHGSRQVGKRESDAWLELLCDGLTFDLLGLAEGPALSPGATAYSFGCAEVSGEGELEAIGLFPGPHLADSANSIPVVRTMLAIVLELLDQLPACRRLQWSPARSVISPDFFTRVVGEWLEGGPYPALGLVGYRTTPTGELESEGVHFLLGHEISLAAPLASDRIEATKLAVRVVDTLVGSQPPDGVTPFEHEGLELNLRPDGARRLIIVEPA